MCNAYSSQREKVRALHQRRLIICLSFWWNQGALIVRPSNIKNF
jgi:hypothetical protein